MGTETEYNIYWDVTGQEPEAAVNLMINILRKEPLGIDKRTAIPTRCFLTNGGLIYKDMGAPEYCTPECPNPRNLVMFDKAGEIIVQELARKVSILYECKVSIYKKNSDGFGNPSGCHENYSIAPPLFHDLLHESPAHATVATWVTFLAIRQALTGGGKVGSEIDDRPCLFQMSQRADFISDFRNNQTLCDRPIIQCRDEPLAHGEMVKRLHVICGDANLCESAILLKMGLSALMLMALEDNYFESRIMPVFMGNVPEIFKEISRDIDLNAKYDVAMIKNGASRYEQRISITDIWTYYLSALSDYFNSVKSQFEAEDSDSYAKVIQSASSILKNLSAGEYEPLFGVCDWVTKLLLLNRIIRKRSLSSEELNFNKELEFELRTFIDMGYANMDISSSIYGKLIRNNSMKRIVSDREIEKALTTPPSRGRARQRVQIMNKFPNNFKYIDWNQITLFEEDEEFKIEFDTPFGYNDPEFNTAIERAQTPGEFFLAWQSFSK